MNILEEILSRGVEEIIDKDHLREVLHSKKKLRIKFGIDPTSPNIHIGRAVVLWKLCQFQELGHKVIFIVGDFTGLIGDTSDKDAERPMLSESEVKKNITSYFDQAYKILDKKKTEVYYNSKWLQKLGFIEIAKIANLFGLHEFEARENIAKRMKAGKRVSLRELLYPLMQGYDSVAVKADVELGGTDQKFNLLAGRAIQKFYGQEPQNIMTMTLMEGLDGRKMSSSWGNAINITEEANNMFGKVMSIPDMLIKKYFILATRTPQDKIENIMKDFSNPRDQKLLLAHTITNQYHGVKTADAAQKNFTAKFSQKSEKEIKADVTLTVRSATGIIVDDLVQAKLAASKSEARRKIKEGAVEVDGKKIINEKANYKPQKGILIRLGRRFLRIS